MRKFFPVLSAVFAASLAIIACSVDSQPPNGNRQTPAAPSDYSPTVQVSTSTVTPDLPLPTVAKPTATFVPLTTPSPTPDIARIDVKEANTQADAGQAIFVDVRDRASFERLHITGAISMPAYEIATRYGELPRDKLIIFYCA